MSQVSITFVPDADGFPIPRINEQMAEGQCPETKSETVPSQWHAPSQCCGCEGEELAGRYVSHPPAPGRGFSLSTTGGVCVSVRVLFLPGFSPPRSLLQKIVNTLLPGGRGFDNDNNNNNNETDE